MCGIGALLFMLGPAALGGIAMMCLNLIINKKAAAVSGAHQAKSMKKASARIEVLGRVIDAAKAVNLSSEYYQYIFPTSHRWWVLVFNY